MGQISLKGIHPVLYALFDRNEHIDESAMRRQIDFCINGGVGGIVVLGLATEVQKLSVDEQLHLIDTVGDAVAGRVPFGVTLASPALAGQLLVARHAAENGAQWLIAQPPPFKGLSEAEVMRQISSIANAVDLPIAIQNAPDYLAVSLSSAALLQLNRLHPNINILKAEAPASAIRRLQEETQGRFQILNGRAALEMPDCIRAGCVGMMPATEICDLLVPIFDGLISTETERRDVAEAKYEAVLPLIVCLMQSVEHITCYGKRLLADRLHLAEFYQRTPSLDLNEWTLLHARRHLARALYVASDSSQ